MGDKNIYELLYNEIKELSSIKQIASMQFHQILLMISAQISQGSLCALALKYDHSYEQAKEWVKADEKEQTLCFCRPGSEAVPFAQPWELRAEFMDIAKDRLLLRGSCFALTPHNRMTVALEIEHPDGKRQEYPCELFRRPDKTRGCIRLGSDLTP